MDQKISFPEAAGTVLDFWSVGWFCPSLLSLVKKLIQLITRNAFFTCIFYVLSEIRNRMKILFQVTPSSKIFIYFVLYKCYALVQMVGSPILLVRKCQKQWCSHFAFRKIDFYSVTCPGQHKCSETTCKK